MRNDSLGIFWFDEPVIKPPKKEKVKKTPPEPVWENDDYLPGLEDAINKQYPLFTDDELINLSLTKTKLIFDIECYRNYFLIAFLEPVSKKYVLFELLENDFLDCQKLRWVLQNFLLIGFNSNVYDIPMAWLATHSHYANTNTLKIASDLIIQQNIRSYELYKEFKIKKHVEIDHIDLIEVLPQEGTLKRYAGRIHAPILQDLPFHPSKMLTAAQKTITRHYCTHDLLDTALLAAEIEKQLDLRVKLGTRYGLDLRSRSDAQIAEAVIRARVEKRKGEPLTKPPVLVGESFKYKVPHFLQFRTSMLNAVLNVVKDCDFIVGENGRVGLPAAITNLNISIGTTNYQMGIGGLHSKEKSVHYIATDSMILRDRDVTSYYPMIILNQRLYPEQLGTDFLIEFKSIVDERINAKHKGDKITADSLKITINGSFGKFGNQYSIMYSPSLVVQVTVTGQLCLLMLIELLELNGIKVVSGNTDGIVIYTHKSNEPLLNDIVKYWESITAFETEETIYDAIYSRDVNNYIALKHGEKPKLKGAYRTKDLSKNPVNEICVEAVLEYLTNNVSMEQTINDCKDIKRFIALRDVKGGAFKDGEFLGKAVRWYKALNNPGTIVYAKSGNDVPLSDGAKPCQHLPKEFPDDVDKEWYINESYRILNDFGIELQNPKSLIDK